MNIGLMLTVIYIFSLIGCLSLYRDCEEAEGLFIFLTFPIAIFPVLNTVFYIYMKSGWVKCLFMGHKHKLTHYQYLDAAIYRCNRCDKFVAKVFKK